MNYELVRNHRRAKGAWCAEVFWLFILCSPAFPTAELNADGEEHLQSEAEERELGLSEQPHGLTCGSKVWTGWSEGLGARLSSASGLP